MNRSNDETKNGVFESVKASMIMLSFGLGTLAFLISIDRPEWFHIHPASGIAAAMSNASTKAPMPGTGEAMAKSPSRFSERSLISL